MASRAVKDDAPDPWGEAPPDSVCPVIGEDNPLVETAQAAWTQIREEVLQRDEFSCVDCGLATEKKLKGGNIPSASHAARA